MGLVQFITIFIFSFLLVLYFIFIADDDYKP